MYETGDLLPVDELPAGTTLLCSGPPMVGKRDLVLRLLGQGLDAGDGTIAISTDATAGEIQQTLLDFTRAEDAPYRIGIVDASGIESADEDVPGRVERVNSPTDLTGVGIGFSQLSERLVDVEQPTGLRVGLLSLSTLLMYSEPDPIMKFLHAFSQRVGERDGVAFVVLHDDAVDAPVDTQLRSFVDGEIRIREQDGRRQLSLAGVPDAEEGWHPMPPLQPPAAVQSGESTVDRTIDQPAVDSLAALIEDVEADRPTLTLCNFQGTEKMGATITSYFDRLNVPVETATLDRDAPTDVAMLHRGPDLLASSTVSDLVAAIDLDDADTTVSHAAARTDLFDHVDQTVFGAHGADRQLLVQVSHTIESMAWRTGQGTIHAGFQEFSRLWDDDRARTIYQRVAEAGVDVHIYGQPDVPIETDAWTLHGADGGELSETWFVGFADPDDTRSGTLVARQTGSNEYDGFWSYRPELAGRLEAYLRTTYGDA